MINLLGFILAVMGIAFLNIKTMSKWNSDTTMKKFYKDVKIILMALTISITLLAVAVGFIIIDLR